MRFKRTSICILPALFFAAVMGCRTVEEHSPANEHLTMATAWYQTSGEMRALSYQAFALARLRLDEDVAKHRTAKGRAVVVDIDETVLNNSPHTAKMILEGKEFPYAWAEWIDTASAEPLPGAVEFLTYASTLGYRIVYISNRSAISDMKGTIENLQRMGFPQVDSENLLLKDSVSSKVDRRAHVSRTHEIALLLGDNLNDFEGVFEKRTVADRSAAVDSVRQEFGKKFIVLPNPMYGDWESALYGYRRGLSSGEKAELRRKALTPF